MCSLPLGRCLEAKPPAGKLLDIVYIFDEAFTNSDSSLNVERLLALLRFCFNSALELTRSLSDGHVCKLRCNNGQLVQIAYGVFADELEKTGQYLIKRYGSWIEVWNMAGSTSTLSPLPKPSKI